MNMSEIKARILSTKEAYVSSVDKEGFTLGYEWAAKQASYEELERLLKFKCFKSMAISDVVRFVMDDEFASPDLVGCDTGDDLKGDLFALNFVVGAKLVYREAMAA